MKKQLILAMTGLLLIGGLSACGKKNTQSNSNEVDTSALKKNKITTHDVNELVQQIQAKNAQQISSVKYHKSAHLVSVELTPQFKKQVRSCTAHSNQAMKKVARTNRKMKQSSKKYQKHTSFKPVYMYISNHDRATALKVEHLNRRINSQIQRINDAIQSKNVKTGSEYIIDGYHTTNAPKGYSNGLYFHVNLKKNARKSGRGRLIKMHLMSSVH